jgi:hypothetical protein
MAVNDITGKVIKTSPQNSLYADGWERAFARKSAHEWLQHPDFISYIIMDPDGWRGDNKSMDDKITYKEFCERFNQSTVMGTICIQTKK